MNLKYASDDSYDDHHNVDDDNVGDDDDDDGDKQLNCLDFCSKGNRCVFVEFDLVFEGVLDVLLETELFED